MKSQEIVLKEKSVILSLKEVVFGSIVSGLCDNYISPYAITIKISTIGLGLLNGIPNAISPWIQLLSRKLIFKLKRKQLINVSIFIQSLFYLVLAIFTILILIKWNISSHLIILFFTVYSLFISLAAPSWTSLLGDIVEKRKINYYFSFRNSLAVLGGLFGIVLGGIILDVFKFQIFHNALVGFVVIFLIGAILNIFRIFLINKIYEPIFNPPLETYFSFKSFIQRGLKTNFGKFVIFNSLLLFSTNLSGPYYNLYIFRDLRFSYSQFLVMLVASSLGFFVGYYIARKIIELIGNIKVLQIVGLLVSLPALLWPITLFLPFNWILFFVILINIIGGIVWSFHGISTTNFFYNNVTEPKRDLCSAYSNIFYGIGIFLGSLIGGFLINLFENPYFNSIMIISLISGFLRFIFGLGFLGVKETNKIFTKDKPQEGL